jgi:hypothetical protein
MRLRVALALLLALPTAACAGWLGIPRRELIGWHAVDSDGTRLIGDLAAEEIRELAGDLARFDGIFAGLAGWPARASSAPLAIYLIRSREIAERFGLGRGVGGWALRALDGTFIAVQITEGRDQDRGVLFHEYTHVLIARNQRSPLPPWYDEGLAMYFSTVSWRDDAVVVGGAPGTAAARLAAGGMLPLDRLFAASTAEMSYAETADFYATSWGLSHYLLSSPSGRRELSEFVKQLARGIPSQQAQPAAFGRSADRLGEELAVHVAHLARGVPVETLLDARDFPAHDPPPAVALEPGEVADALGALALEVVAAGDGEGGRHWPGLARGFLSMAHEEDPRGAARVEAALGEARAVSGDAEDGLADARGALARAPGDARVALRTARVALLAAEEQDPSASPAALGEAEKLFRHALALDAESTSAWFGLGQTLVKMGRADDAFTAFQTARRFGWSERLDVALARLHLERGERDLAAGLLRPIAQSPHKGPTQEEASALLETILH